MRRYIALPCPLCGNSGDYTLAGFMGEYGCKYGFEVHNAQNRYHPDYARASGADHRD